MRRHLCALTTLLLSAAPGFAADAAKGHADYDAHCKSCHGATGAPNAAVAKMMKVEIRDLGSPEVQAQTDAELAKTIADGKGKMKPIPAASAGDVVAFLRTFKK